MLLKYFLECNHTVSTDTRKIEEGSLFFALKGDNFNGNEFAREALSKGAKYAVIDEEKYQSNPKEFILVDNCLEALQQLANEYRNTFDVPVLGITGSNGKTTAKELITAVLSMKFKVHATPGNFNNHIGLPLTLLSAPPDSEFLILEMGDNHSGEIKRLSEIGDPNFGLVTNVGKDHIEGFGSFEANKMAKKELFDYLQQNSGLAFIPEFEPDLHHMSKGVKKKVVFGSETQEPRIKLQGANPFLVFNINDRPEIKTQLIGEYNIKNIAMAVSIGRHFEVGFDLIEKAIANYLPANNRSQYVERNGHKIFLDAYNANPSSVDLALKSFNNQHLLPNRMVILGDMLELGEESLKEHQSIVDYLNTTDFDVRLVGSEYLKTHRDKKIKTYPSRFELMEELKSVKLPPTQFLLKGSRGIRLEEIVEVL